ncbi:MAG: hypothetical protein QOH43_2073, partial [Solirubrobacteraceae bacterium]|nr:hypothetical protein [Solirubrobacteraceae bacterium]
MTHRRGLKIAAEGVLAVILQMATQSVYVMGTTVERVRRERGTVLAEEQAALRRLAALVARGASSGEVFGAVAHEAARVLHLPMVALGRFEDDGATVTILGSRGDRPHAFHAGTRWPLDGTSMAA